MCGGVGFKIKNIPEEELKKYYSPEIVRRLRKDKRVESFFWHKTAVLPILTKNGVELKEWGNKDSELKLPKTGWARDESLKAGKWDYLQPEVVDIPVDSGYEKKTWFDLPEGTKGILAKKDGVEKVYMITKAANDEYLRQTGHDREPLGEKRNFEHTE